MSDLEQAARLALDALKLHGEQYPHMVKGYCLDAITELESALKQQAEPVVGPVDLDQQVRDISAGIGLPPVESPVVPDPVIDCDCGRRWCWTDDAGWNAKQAEPVECPLEIHPIHAKYCSAQVCDFCKAQQTGPVVEPVAWHFQSFEDWWDSHGFHNAFEAGQIDGKPLAKLAWEVAREIAPQPKQAEPVVEPVVDQLERQGFVMPPGGDAGSPII